MGYSVRTIKSLTSYIRSMALKGRYGFVIENVRTETLDSYIDYIKNCMSNMGICKEGALNNAICIKKFDNVYTIIMLVKTSMENTVDLYNIDKLDCNIMTFKKWAQLNAYY